MYQILHSEIRMQKIIMEGLHLSRFQNMDSKTLSQLLVDISGTNIDLNAINTNEWTVFMHDSYNGHKDVVQSREFKVLRR